jgi:hypothetical protein
MGENADTNPEVAMPDPAGRFDVYLAYTDADEDIAQALQQELHRQKPGLRIWREKRRIGVGDAFNQAADMAISGSSVVLAIWTKHAARSGAFTLEARRAMTLRKPFVNLLADVPTSALAPPYSKYSAFQIDEVVALAGRSSGWVPPRRPDREDLEDELKPVLDRIALHMRQSGDQAAAIADGLIESVLNAAGDAHTARFETMLKSVAPGDPATAIEVLALNDYGEAEINTLLTPQSVRLASRSEDREPQPWGGWYVRPHVRKIAPVHKDNGLLYAIGGFLVAGLGALALWVMGSTLTAGDSSTQTASVDGSGTPGGTPASGTALLPDTDALPPPRNAQAPQNCSLNADGSITGAPCTLTANIAPLIDPDGDSAEGSIPASVPEELEACIVSLGGAIENAPCRLNARYVPPAIPVPDAIKPPCISQADGAIENTPCTLEGPLSPPEPERVEVEVPVEADLPPLCARNEDGSVSGAPCVLASDLSAPEPERIEVRVPADVPAPEPCLVGEGSEIANAPCLLSSPLAAIEAERIEVPGETIVETEELPTCRGLIAGREVEEGCKLDEAVRLAYLPCNEDLSNYPCTLDRAARRLAAGEETPASPGPQTVPDRAGPVASSTVPRRGDFPPRPLDMPETLRPCEEAINTPCRFTVANAGLDTLTQIAESYYGNTQAWCRVYRANEGTFGNRNEPRRGSDPNCIFLSDVLDLPPANPDNRYSLRGCPPAQLANQCGAPFD